MRRYYPAIGWVIRRGLPLLPYGPHRRRRRLHLTRRLALLRCLPRARLDDGNHWMRKIGFRRLFGWETRRRKEGRGGGEGLTGRDGEPERLPRAAAPPLAVLTACGYCLNGVGQWWKAWETKLRVTVTYPSWPS